MANGLLHLWQMACQLLAPCQSLRQLLPDYSLQNEPAHTERPITPQALARTSAAASGTVWPHERITNVMYQESKVLHVSAWELWDAQSMMLALVAGGHCCC